MKHSISLFIKPIVWFFVIVVLAACSNDEHDPFKQIAGKYRVISIRSNVELDMNNDGVKTDDLLKEITDEHRTLDNQMISFYDFSAPRHFLDIKYDEYNGFGKSIAVIFPHQFIDVIGGDKPFLSMYLDPILGYTYEIDNATGAFVLKERTTVYDSAIVDPISIEEVQILDDGQLRLVLTKRIFDFVDLSWIEAKLTVTYEKVI